MGVNVPGGGLLVKQASRLGALADEAQVDFIQPHVFDHAAFFSPQEKAAFAVQADMGKGQPPDFSGGGQRAALAERGADKDGFALAPPAGRAGQIVGVGIAPHAARQVVGLNVFHRAAVPHPNADGPGAVLDDAVGKHHPADGPVGFRADFQGGIPAVQDAAGDGHVFAGPVALGHGGGGFEHDGVVPRFHQAVGNDYVLTAVRIDAVVVGPPVVVQDLDVMHAHPPAARHMQRPESGVFQGDARDFQAGHVFKQQKPWPEGRAAEGTLVKTGVHVGVGKYPVALAVDDAASGDADILRVPRA